MHPRALRISLVVAAIAPLSYLTSATARAESESLMDARMRREIEALARMQESRLANIERRYREDLKLASQGALGLLSIEKNSVESHLSAFEGNEVVLSSAFAGKMPGSETVRPELMKLPTPPPKTAMYYDFWSNKMREQAEGFVRRHAASGEASRDNPLAYTATQAPGAESIASGGPASCSAGGFIHSPSSISGRPFVWNNDCRSKSEFDFAQMDGTLLKTTCYPEVPTGTDGRNVESLSSEHFQYLDMCHPMLFGFFPQANQKNKRALGFCFSPPQRGATLSRNPEAVNRYCEHQVVVFGHLIRKLIPEIENSEERANEYLARLASHNHELWRSLAGQIKAHCGDPLHRSFQISEKERQSCGALERRVQAIERRFRYPENTGTRSLATGTSY